MADNIHVAVRVRPLIARERTANKKICWKVQDKRTVYQISEDGKPISTSSYTFDRVFDLDEANDIVYKDLCQPIVQSAMDGVNGTIFAYGQTASGKTYTMSGFDKETPGVIGLTVREIFNIIENTPERIFLLRVSYLEIYNEQLKDLLNPSTSKSLKITENFDKQVVILNLTEEVVQTEEQIISLMAKGERNRHVGETAMNSESSRSHTILSMIIESRSVEDTDEGVKVSHLNLVDLAGSEPAAQISHTKIRFKEGVGINLSLLALGQTITQIAEKGSQFVNFRGSKLTRILQNSLGGNARTAFVCTVTPASIEQTESTLKFATRAKCIENKPVVNEVVNESALLKKYSKEIERLRSELQKIKENEHLTEMRNLSKQLEDKDRLNLELEKQLKSLKEKLVVSSHSSVLLGRKTITNEQLRKARRETWCAPLCRRGLSKGTALSTVKENDFLLNAPEPFMMLPSEANFSFLSNMETQFESSFQGAAGTSSTIADDNFFKEIAGSSLSFLDSRPNRVTSMCEFGTQTSSASLNDAAIQTCSMQSALETCNSSVQTDPLLHLEQQIEELNHRITELEEENQCLKSRSMYSHNTSKFFRSPISENKVGCTPDDTPVNSTDLSIESINLKTTEASYNEEAFQNMMYAELTSLGEMQDEMQILHDQIQQMDMALKELSTGVSLDKRSVNECFSHLRNLQNSNARILCDVGRSIEELVSDLGSLNTAVQQEMGLVNDQVKSLETQLSEKDVELSDLKTAHEEALGKIAEFERKEIEMKRVWNYLENVSQKLKEKCLGSKEQEQESEQSKAMLNELKAENSSLKFQLANLEDKNAELEKELKQSKACHLKELNLHKNHALICKQCIEIECLCSHLEEKSKKLQEECEYASKQRCELKSRIRRLETQLSDETIPLKRYSSMPSEDQVPVAGVIDSVKVDMLHNKLYHTEKELKKVIKENKHLRHEMEQMKMKLDGENANTIQTNKSRESKAATAKPLAERNPMFFTPPKNTIKKDDGKQEEEEIDIVAETKRMFEEACQPRIRFKLPLINQKPEENLNEDTCTQQ